MSDNLKPFKKENAAEMGARGGKASQEARRKNKKLKACLNALLSLEPSEEAKAELREFGLIDEELNNQMYLAVRVFKKAIQGDVKAAEFIRDITGQRPINPLEKAKINLMNAQAKALKERPDEGSALTQLDRLLQAVDNVASDTLENSENYNA